MARVENSPRLPDVSVVLPVYNGTRFLAEAMTSILTQRDVSLELLIIDDGSTDDSDFVIRSFHDPRIRAVRLPSNVGLAKALNIGVRLSRAALIARQDQDDVSAPERLATQLAFLKKHPDVALVGTWAKIISQTSDGGWQEAGIHRHPTQDRELRLRLLWNNPFVHSSVMFTREAFDSAGGYSTDPTTSWPEDYDLWSRIMREGKVANLAQPLLTYRATKGGMSDAYRDRIRDGVLRISERNLASVLDPKTNWRDLQGIARALNGISAPRVSLLEALRRARIFQRAISAITGSKWRLPWQRFRWTMKLLIRSTTLTGDK